MGGLASTDIPIGARILSVVDCFDALTSDRPYRAKLSDFEALAILNERRGQMYDPLIVEAFFEMHSRLLPPKESLSERSAALTARIALGVDVKHVVHSGGLLEAGPRGSSPETRMRTLPVVVVQPADQGGRPGIGIRVRPARGPLPQERLDEALGFAIGARGVGAREFVAHAPAPAKRCER